MIPSHLDDGFTVEPAEGIFCRPMLWNAKREWKHIASEDPDAAWWYINDSYVFNHEDVTTHYVDEHKVAVIQAVCGYTSAQESEDFQGLHDSVQLHMTNPGLSTLDCGTCRLYCVDHRNGELYIGAHGHPVPLPKNAKVPCEDKGCAKVHWTDPLGLSNERWSKTWRHYWLHRDNPKLMLDPIFRRNASLIRWITEYGRDRRFDPFIGGSSNGGAPNVQAKGTTGSVPHRACGSGGCGAGRACGTGCQSECAPAVD
jgi:hypothetical protein